MENVETAIFEGLNAEQKQAVSCVDGPVLIVAGAGSGKTRVLTCRIANILSRGVDPSRIMALTFTKKAATEMKERIALMVGPQKARKIVMGTFHSIFIRFLREYADRLGFPSSFTIYDQSDSTSAVKACIKELGLDDKVYKPKDVLSRISFAKNNLVTDAAYRNNPQILQNDSVSKRPRICDVYSLYCAKCHKSGVMDFDDILLYMNILFRDHPEAKAAIASRFSYVMVDEYQDTNFSQYLIMKKLCEVHRNLCVVGDDSQSIYAFRGAKIENILNFRKDYPEGKTFRLEKNYRSTSNIVDAANSLIAKNQNRIPKNCVAVGGAGEKIRLLKSFSEKEEAVRISDGIISRMQSDHAEYRDFAILYRTNSQSRAIEEALRKRNLPYMIYSGNSFFERAEVKDIMAYMKLVVNVNDDESFKRVVNTPARGIGDTSLAALYTMAHELKVSFFKAAYSERFAEFGLKAPAVAKIRSFCDMVSKFASRVESENADELAVSLSDACGLYAHFKSDSSIESQSRASNIEELVNSVTQYVEDRQNEYLEELETEVADGESVTFPIVTLGEFLENISLLSSVDVSEEEDSSNKIALMTVHSSKGLEFPFVFIAGMEENLFPSGGDLASPADIEEERRLFYVALTRAKKVVSLSFADSRMKNGKHEENSPSRFLKEIDSAYISNPQVLKMENEDSGRPGERFFSGFGSGNSSFRRSGFGNSSYGGTKYSGSGSGNSGYGGTKYSGSGSGNSRFGGSRYGMSGAATTVPKPSSSVRTVPKPSSAAVSPTAREQMMARPLPPKVPDSQFTPDPPSTMKVRDRIEHNRFGFGRILEISGNAPDVKAKVLFDDYGEKVLLLKFAKLRHV